MPVSTDRTISFSSTNIAYYYTSGSVTGKIYAVKLDGSTKFDTAGQFITFSIAYTAPCASFNPMTGSATGTFSGATYTISNAAST